jgi:hypothetical protein
VPLADLGVGQDQVATDAPDGDPAGDLVAGAVAVHEFAAQPGQRVVH